MKGWEDIIEGIALIFGILFWAVIILFIAVIILGCMLIFG